MDEDGPPDAGPDGAPSGPLHSWIYAVCCCGDWIGLRPFGLRPLLQHVAACAALHSRTGRGDELSSCGDVETNPGPLTSPSAAAVKLPSTGFSHLTARGSNLLSCGDVEPNPGPHKTKARRVDDMVVDLAAPPTVSAGNALQA